MTVPLVILNKFFIPSKCTGYEVGGETETRGVEISEREDDDLSDTGVFFTFAVINNYFLKLKNTSK